MRTVKRRIRLQIITALVFMLPLAACGDSIQNSFLKKSDLTIASGGKESGTDYEDNKVDSRQAVDGSLDSHAEGYNFPDSIELQFKKVELTALFKAEVGEEWVKTATVPFGSIKNESVILDVYKVPEGDFCGFDNERVVLLTHKNEKYRYPDCFSDRIDDDNREQHRTLFRLDYKKTEQGDQIVHGAVELTANGPGRMAYYYFDAVQGTWFGFEDWGFPKVVDLDGDGEKELSIRFPGLHMNWPDITLYRWDENGLSSSSSIKNTLGLPNLSFSSVTLNDQTNHIEIEAAWDLKAEMNEKASYSYENGKLKRLN